MNYTHNQLPPPQAQPEVSHCGTVHGNCGDFTEAWRNSQLHIKEEMVTETPL